MVEALMLTVVTWLWGEKYSNDYVEKLRSGVARNIKRRHRFLAVTDRSLPGIETAPIRRTDLLEVHDGCYVRLQMFDKDWREGHGIEELLCLDLDLVVTGKIDDLLPRAGTFKILKGGHFNPCPFNGSVMYLGPDAPQQIWDRFNIEDANRAAFIDNAHRGTDQTWIAHVAPLADHWVVGPASGIWAFGKPPWPRTAALPSGARIVAFPGRRDPSRLTSIQWIRDAWR